MFMPHSSHTRNKKRSFGGHHRWSVFKSLILMKLSFVHQVRDIIPALAYPFFAPPARLTVDLGRAAGKASIQRVTVPPCHLLDLDMK